MQVLALYLISQGGKRLRPALVFLGAGWGEWQTDRLRRAAAALELIHVASLYHDDVMDQATLRRSVMSANAKWGNSLAALGGTYLVARAIALLAGLGPAVNRLTSEASVRLATGQLLEVENAYNLDLTEAVHLEILRRKTASLFELPLRLGALLSGASREHIEALGAYGRNLGLAFQLVDDLLDWRGDVKSLGKETTTDIREGVFSLALLRGLQQESDIHEELRSLLGHAVLSDADIILVREIVHRAGLMASSFQTAESFARAAQNELTVLPRGPSRQSLHDLAEFTLLRNS